jgi:hypothetical protein
MLLLDRVAAGERGDRLRDTRDRTRRDRTVAAARPLGGVLPPKSVTATRRSSEAHPGGRPDGRSASTRRGESCTESQSYRPPNGVCRRFRAFPRDRVFLAKNWRGVRRPVSKESLVEQRGFSLCLFNYFVVGAADGDEVVECEWWSAAAY